MKKNKKVLFAQEKHKKKKHLGFFPVPLTPFPLLSHPPQGSQEASPAAVITGSQAASPAAVITLLQGSQAASPAAVN